MKQSYKSLLRYPGGKTRAINHLMAHLPEGTNELCSSFLGGGSFELACTKKGIRVHGYDAFNPLVDYWQCLLEDNIRLAREVSKYYPLSKDHFYNLQSNINHPDKYERASRFYVLNRSSFSGSTLSGGMSPGHPRFTESSINRIVDFKNNMLSVQAMDFTESIKEHPDTFLYLDPPYMIKNKLYGKKGNMHKDFDHLELFDILKNRDNWMLSYNNCPEILDLYQEFKIIPLSWKYGMSENKESKEVLILNN